MKRVLSWCGGLSVALLAVLTSAQDASAQAALAFLPEVGEITLRSSEEQAGQYYDIYEERLPDPAPGFRAYNVWAQVKNLATSQGKFVNAFEQLNISGVHQVWEDFRGAVQTPYPGYFTSLPAGTIPNAQVPQSLDSYMAFRKTDQSNGRDPSETNDGSNPAGLDASFGAGRNFAGIVGIGDLGVHNRGAGDPAALGLNGREGRLHLAKIVLHQGAAGAHEIDGVTVAYLSGALGGEGDGNSANGGEIDRWSATNPIAIGGPVVPEPAMGVLALTGMVGLLGLRRRNG